MKPEYQKAFHKHSDMLRLLIKEYYFDRSSRHLYAAELLFKNRIAEYDEHCHRFGLTNYLKEIL